MTEEKSAINIEDSLTTAARYIRQHDITAAVGQLQEALEQDPDNTRIRNLLGTCYLRLGEHSRAVACWEEVLVREPDNKTARDSMKSFYSPANQFWIKRYEDALWEIEKKNFAAAQPILHQLLEEHDGQVRIYQLLGLTYLAMNDKCNAELVFKKGLNLDKSNSQLLEYLKSVEEQEKPVLINEYDKNHINESNRSRVLNSKLLWAVSGVVILALVSKAGISMLNNGDSVKQAVQNKVAAKAEPKSVSVITTGEDREMLSSNISVQTESAMEGAPYDVENEGFYYEAGRRAYLNRDWKNAVNNFRVVVDMKTYSYLHREAQYYLARCQYLAGDLAGAKESYQVYLKDFPESNYYDDSVYYLGCIYYRQNDKARAIQMFKELEKISPQSGYMSTDIYREAMS
ncbi:MAG: tetratricopeptide repeat protein [Syntrophomonadaceae bacterium]|jgi:TolA-binding protein